MSSNLSRKALSRVLILSLGLLLIATSWAWAIKRQPGRPAPGKGDGSGLVFDLSDLSSQPGPHQEQDGEKVIPGLFELVPYGVPEVGVQPAHLYQEPASAVSSDADYFARRIEAPLEGQFIVLGARVWVAPSEDGQTPAVFPEIMLTTGLPGGGPDLNNVLARCTDLAAQPGQAQILVDFSGAAITLQGPAELYLVVRFPGGGSTGAALLLDTDQDYGLYSGTNWLATEGGPFFSFEQAARTVRPAFYGLEDLAPPGLAGDQLAVGLYIGTDSLAVPADPPRVMEVRLPVDSAGSQAGLRVRLEVSPFLADGRPLAFEPETIRVTHVLPGTYGDSLIADRPLDGQGWIDIPGLEPDRTYLLRFAVLESGGKAGLPSGAYFILPVDPDESNDSRELAVDFEFSVSDAGLCRGAASGRALITTPGDFDFYRVRLTDGDSLVAGFEWTNCALSALDPVLSLTDSSGLVLDYVLGRTASVSILAPYTGDYYLLVNDRGILTGADKAGGIVNQAVRVYELAAHITCRRGDIDGNGRIDYRDAFLVFVMVSSVRDTLAFTPAQRFAADYDGDGQIAGDIADFIGVLGQVRSVPSRDLSRSVKQKATDEESLLAGTGGQTWRLSFADGSAVLLSLESGVLLTALGKEAESLVGLLETPKHGRNVDEALLQAPQLPKAAKLFQNYPNPFNPSTVISFELDQPGVVELAVFDVHGRRVRTVYQGNATAGLHFVSWDGTDGAGGVLSSGVYFCRLRAENILVTRKMILLK